MFNSEHKEAACEATVDLDPYGSRNMELDHMEQRVKRLWTLTPTGHGTRSSEYLEQRVKRLWVLTPAGSQNMEQMSTRDPTPEGSQKITCSGLHSKYFGSKSTWFSCRKIFSSSKNEGVLPWA
jgi:hypothetical protein